MVRTLTSIHIYPIKSLAGISLPEATVQARGLQYDRRWMLIDETGRFVTQREIPELALLGTRIEASNLLVFSRENPAQRLHIPLNPAAGELQESTAQVWMDSCDVWMYQQHFNNWFSDLLRRPLRLVYMPDTSHRQIDLKYASAGQAVSFADAYPFLIIGQASLDLLNQQLEQSLPMNRFRPNFVFSGGSPHEEDRWEDIQIGEASFRGVKPCARCIITTTDQDTAQRAAEPLKTLAGYRQKANKILFGQNLIQTGLEDSVVRVGDLIKL